MARIVVVERDPHVLSAGVKILQSRGHDVAGITDKGAVIKVMRALSANLLIVDVATLGADNVVKIIGRLQSVFPHLATILISDTPATLVEASASLAVAGIELVRTLQKPLRRTPFLDAIAEALSVQARIEAKSRSSRPRTSTRNAARRRQRKIVVIDPDNAFRRRIFRALKSAGYFVCSAADGEKGLSLVQKHRPDAVIVEIVIPGKDGLTTIGEIQIRLPRAKIIAMSGANPTAPEANLPIAWMFGASRSLRKPFPMVDLLATLTELLAEPLR